MYRVLGMAASGNCHKVRVALDVLGLPYQWTEVDMAHGATRTPEFLAMNPNGKVPVLEVEPGTYIPESNAILCYLADGTQLMPQERLAKARVMQWLFFEQYSHEPYIAVARFWAIAGITPEESDREAKMRAGTAALRAMERHLTGREFLVAERYTIADIALYAYTHVAPEGGFELEPYPAIRAWLERVAAQPGHIKITE